MRRGGIVLFSSLTPHATGPNRTAEVRKSYIVQFAPDGARAVHENPDTGERSYEPQNHPDRQFRIG